MKLLIVTPYYAPAWAYGGPPKLLSEFAVAMVKRDHDVAVATTDAFDHRRNKKLHEMIGGVAVYRFKNVSNWLTWKQKIILAPGLADFLDKTIRNYDFVLNTDWRNGINIQVYKACRKYHVPYGVAVFGELPIASDWKAGVKKIFDFVYGRRILRDAALLLAQTNQEMRTYQTAGAAIKKIKLWPLALDLTPFKKLPSKQTSVKKTILFVGRFNKYKGVDIIIRSLTMLKDHLAVRLVLVGRDDGELNNLKKLSNKLKLNNDIVFTGPLYNAQVIKLYRAADLFVITPTHAEETPLAGLMALAAGCPVVVNRNAQIPWLDENRAGITITSNKKLAATLLNLLSDDKMLKRMSGNARKLALTNYNWSTRAKQFEQLVRNV